MLHDHEYVLDIGQIDNTPPVTPQTHLQSTVRFSALQVLSTAQLIAS